MNAPARPSRRRGPTAPEAPLTIAVVGAGRAGSALAVALHDAGIRIAAVHSRRPASAAALALRTGAEPVPTAVAAALRADVTLLTVPDADVTGVAATIAAAGIGLRDRTVVHCSGALGRGALAALRQVAAGVGVCHPLQALTTDSALSAAALRGAFFGVDADPPVRARLELLVRAVGGVPFTAPAGDRALYHAAAVLAGNAPLALLSRAVELLEASGVEHEIAAQALASLLEGAARNARALGVRGALTGPVVRDDAATVARHLGALGGDRELQRLYRGLAAETLRATGADGRGHVAELLAASA
ncbi:MAG TPA: Rossmann-like and DUF2520 domain-containing protein [Candidatus Dormibacteraeota bacterium]|nr:Rossmann-like and DUF2520 domain-containing protein [Candidatus Dormibacteraeota bacterium]